MTERRDDTTGGEASGGGRGKGRRTVLGGDDGRPPVVILREGPSPRVRRRRWIAAVLLAAALLGGLYVGRDAVARWTGVEIFGAAGGSGTAGAPGPGAPGASGASGSAADDRGAPESGRAAADTAAARLLDRRLDSLALTLDRYRERHSDFVQGRLGCEGLSRGFTAVQDRFGAASQAFGRLEVAEASGASDAGEAAAPRERYRRLSVGADSVRRLFAASGCVE